MSVYSMTGYGSATNRGALHASLPLDDRGSNLDRDEVSSARETAREPVKSTSAALAIDVRSVNGRFLDITIKLPDEARALEAPLRDLVASRVKRGKVEMRVAVQRESETQVGAPSPELLLQLARLEGTVRAYFTQATPLSVHEILTLGRQSVLTARSDDEVMRVASLALDAFVDSRKREGDKLTVVLQAGATRLRQLAKQAAPLVPQAVQRQQERFIERWREALKLVNAASPGAEVSGSAASERALGEAAAYALRIDVAEELTRLNAHLDELDSLLQKGGELGKRLDFLVQELHREANTLGAKSQALELSNVSMDMRVTIEQMREQVQNIE